MKDDRKERSCNNVLDGQWDTAGRYSRRMHEDQKKERKMSLKLYFGQSSHEAQMIRSDRLK